MPASQRCWLRLNLGFSLPTLAPWEASWHEMGVAFDRLAVVCYLAARCVWGGSLRCGGLVAEGEDIPGKAGRFLCFLTQNPDFLRPSATVFSLEEAQAFVLQDCSSLGEEGGAVRPFSMGQAR